MKKATFLSVSVAILMSMSCNSSTENSTTSSNKTTTKEVAKEAPKAKRPISGKNLFSKKGCVACHQLATKTAGPSLNEIAAAYDGNKDGLIAFLKEEAEPIVDPAQAAIMKPQLAVTKNFKPEELDAIVEYILSSK